MPKVGVTLDGRAVLVESHFRDNIQSNGRCHTTRFEFVGPKTPAKLSELLPQKILVQYKNTIALKITFCV